MHAGEKKSVNMLVKKQNIQIRRSNPGLGTVQC